VQAGLHLDQFSEDLLNQFLLRTALSLTAAFAIGAAAAPSATHAAQASGKPCFDPTTVGAAARGTGNARSGDHRTITPAVQRRIDAKTASILKRRRTAVTKKLVTIPVYVHVMTSKSGAGTVSAARIKSEVDVLNQTYSGKDADHPGGVDTGFRFTLAGTDRYANDTWHADGQSATYRARTHRGGRNALNIWLVDFEYLGIATFPWDQTATPGSDGIRVQFTSLPGGSATHFNEGKTVTHETGHWLGLFHTFQDGCTGVGDEVVDTAAQASPSSGCPVGRDSCKSAGLDPIHNYLDYSYDACYQLFTAGQVTRMTTMWSAYRA
jgi:hypothetical protein